MWSHFSTFLLQEIVFC